jgi:carboxylesterase
VSGLVPHLEAAGLPYAMPILRGHGTKPEDLRGVTWHGWYEDAERALDELLTRCERVVVMGLSMGGVVALHLGVQRPEHLAGIVTVAPALRLSIPAAFLLPVLGRSGRLAAVDPLRAFEDATLAAGSTNYPSAPLSAVYALVQFGKIVKRELPRLRVPLLVLYTPRDRVVQPEGAAIVYANAGTPAAEKAIRAFDRSGHEMLMDRQREEVFAAIMVFIEEKRGVPAQ